MCLHVDYAKQAQHTHTHICMAGGSDDYASWWGKDKFDTDVLDMARAVQVCVSVCLCLFVSWWGKDKFDTDVLDMAGAVQVFELGE